MNWGSDSLQPKQAGQQQGAGYGLGQPLVVGEIGNAEYAQGQSKGPDIAGLLGAAAQGFASAKPQQQQMEVARHNPMAFGSFFQNPGASAVSGLLNSNQNYAGK